MLFISETISKILKPIQIKLDNIDDTSKKNIDTNIQNEVNDTSINNTSMINEPSNLISQSDNTTNIDMINKDNESTIIIS